MNLKTLVIAALVLAGCAEETITGDQFFTEESFSITRVDTISIGLSTIRFDSLETSFRERLLVGSYTDGRLGEMHSAPYFQIGISETASYSLSGDVFEYDSITMAIEFDGYTYFTEETNLPISIYRVTDDIKLDGLFLYNTSDFNIATDADLYGRGLIRPGRVQEEYAIEVRLRDDIGQELFDRIVNEPERLRINEEVVKFFKGFAIVADSLPNGGFFGLTKRTSLNLYYHNRSVIPNVPSIFGFPIEDNIYFNHIEHNRSGTQLTELNTQETALPSTSTANEAYMVSGLGLGLRIDLPWLEHLLYAGDEFLISRAILRIKPVNRTFDEDFAPLPEEMVLYEVDKNNDPIRLLTEKATLTVDTDYDRNTYYEVDVSSFVLDQLESRRFDGEGLMLITDDDSYFSSVDKVYVGDGQNESQSHLTLYVILKN